MHFIFFLTSQKSSFVPTEDFYDKSSFILSFCQLLFLNALSQLEKYK